MHLINFVKNPFIRIQIAHILAILLLILNSLVFTQSGTDSAIQLLIAFVILVHHLDDINIKKNLKLLQNKLQEDTNLFNKNVVVSESDLNGVITFVNDNYTYLTGYNKDELIGFTHAKIKGTDTTDEVYKDLWETIKNDNTFIGILKNKKKDGSAFWVDVHISPIIINQKKTGYKSIMFEITDKMITQNNLQYAIREKELKIQEQLVKFEFLINSSRDGFWDYDLVKKEFYLSEGWKKRLGFEIDQKLTYLDYLSLMPDENRFEHHIAMHNLIEQYPKNLDYIHFRVRYPIITKDNEKLVIEDVGDIFFNKEQNPIRITGFHRDITDQERQSKIIESQNRISAMGEVISNIAHQWRQPIGAINNTLNDLEFDIELEDLTQIDAQVFLDTSSKVKKYTAYLSQTIDDFKNLSSNEKQKTNFILYHSIEEAYNIVQSEYKKNNIHFQIIESSETKVEIHGYNRELQQVLINILNNSKDIFLEKKVNTPSVMVSIINSKEEISIIIHDNAGGIPDNIMPKIFEPYFTTKHESVGTGIGLYMSRKIITEHFNGSLEAQNEDNGVKFIISIPKVI